MLQSTHMPGAWTYKRNWTRVVWMGVYQLSRCYNHQWLWFLDESPVIKISWISWCVLFVRRDRVKNGCTCSLSAAVSIFLVRSSTLCWLVVSSSHGRNPNKRRLRKSTKWPRMFNVNCIMVKIKLPITLLFACCVLSSLFASFNNNNSHTNLAKCR